MKYDVYIIGKPEFDIERFTNGDDAIKFIHDNDYKVYNIIIDNTDYVYIHYT